jgi:AcrR family transcriptional regulator
VNQTKDARRDQVVTAALKLIGESGMTSLTTAAIAREVGMSEANIYRHFQNKEEILSETIKRIGEGLMRNVDIAMNSASTPIGRLRRAFQLHLQYVDQNRGIPRLLFSDDIHSNKTNLKPKLLEIISGYVLLLENLIKEGKKDGSLKQYIEPKSTALMFIGMVQISIIRWILNDFKLSIEDEGLTLWNNYEQGITAHQLNKDRIDRRIG